MTLWLVLGSVAAILIYIAVVKSKAKKQGRLEAEGEHLANYAEKIGEINEGAKKIDEKADKLEPETDEEWDDFFTRGRRPTERDVLRRKPGDKR